MPAQVILTVTSGKMDRPQFVFAERTTSILGRDDDCDPRVSNDKEHLSISRLHCLLDVDPPDIRVRDLGSKHGTFVNGVKIGQRTSEDQRGKPLFPEHDLQEGDELRLGDPADGNPIVFWVSVFVPVYCAGCSCEILEDSQQLAEQSPGVLLCQPCYHKARTAPPQEPPRPQGRRCVRCGRDVSGEAGANRQGEFICAACKGDPLPIMRHLLDLAQSGQKDLRILQGYSILGELGRGGMGAVYLARHERSGEEVALKVMLPRIALQERARDLFLREAENTRALKHPNVVRLRDAGCSQGTFFFTLEYCDGGSVDRLVKQRGGRLATDEAVPIILQVLVGLEYAHNVELPGVKLADGSSAPARGLVHRDLKPANIFLSESDGQRVAKVGDYGLAKAFDLAGLSGQSATGAAAGTPVFLPRQQVVNFKYCQPEVDVWATAASLYYMLTGAVPRDFGEGRDPWQVVLQTGAVPIRRRDPSLPTKLAEVIDQALIDNPGIPFKTAADFQRALESVL